MDASTHIRVLDGPDRGRHNLFLGMGLASGGETFLVVERDGRPDVEFPILEGALRSTLTEHGLTAAHDFAHELARTRTLRVYRRVGPERTFRRTRYAYVGLHSLEVADTSQGLRVVPGPALERTLPRSTPGQVDGRFHAACLSVETRTRALSTLVAALDEGPVRDSATRALTAAVQCVTDARRLAVVGSQLAGGRAERVLSEITALERVVEAAVDEVTDLHLQVRARPASGFDELSPAEQLRAITDGVRELLSTPRTPRRGTSPEVPRRSVAAGLSQQAALPGPSTAPTTSHVSWLARALGFVWPRGAPRRSRS